MDKRIFIIVALHLLPLFSVAQQVTDSIWVRRQYRKQEVMVSMRDGVRLFTSVYAPVDTLRKHPFLIFRTPYSCAPYGDDNWLPFWKNYWMNYLKRGYILVFQDVRGRFMSEGTFVNIRPFVPVKRTNSDIDEASDAFDTIEWLVAHVPGNNGRVGASGISAGGFYTAMAALSGHPALKAVSPQAPVTDWFTGDDLHHLGAFFLQDAFDFYFVEGFGDPRPRPTKQAPAEVVLPDTDAYRYYLHIGALPNFTKLTGDSIAFWKDLMNHPDRDSWWEKRNDRQYVSRIRPGTGVLITGGLFDAEDEFGTFALYRAMMNARDLPVKLVIGPWYHGGWSGGKGDHLDGLHFGSNTGYWYVQEREIPFFDHYLLGGSLDTIPPVSVFFTGENKWHFLQRWPPAEGVTTYYLGADHRLRSGADNGWEEYISDPANPVPYTERPPEKRNREYMVADQRFAWGREDVLAYQTDVLQDSVAMAGPLTADLVVSVSGTDADFVVKLIDCDQTGGQRLVRADVIRGKYRESLSRPSPFVPGRATHIRFSLPDFAHVFPLGHRIMVQVQSSWFPLVDRNPQRFLNIYRAKDSDYRPCRIKIFHSSRIILPLLGPHEGIYPE